MVRWVRLALAGTVVLAILGVGIAAGLFLVANGRWIDIEVPPWLHRFFGSSDGEMWLPGLLAGWILCALLGGTLLLWSMYYVWRRRQYETLVQRLERELADLRNMPFEDPAPLEDLPERPDPLAREILETASRQIEGDVEGES